MFLSFRVSEDAVLMQASLALYKWRAHMALIGAFLIHLTLGKTSLQKRAVKFGWK